MNLAVRNAKHGGKPKRCLKNQTNFKIRAWIEVFMCARNNGHVVPQDVCVEKEWARGPFFKVNYWLSWMEKCIERLILVTSQRTEVRGNFLWAATKRFTEFPGAFFPKNTLFLKRFQLRQISNKKFGLVWNGKSFDEGSLKESCYVACLGKKDPTERLFCISITLVGSARFAPWALPLMGCSIFTRQG